MRWPPQIQTPVALRSGAIKSSVSATCRSRVSMKETLVTPSSLAHHCRYWVRNSGVITSMSIEVRTTTTEALGPPANAAKRCSAPSGVAFPIPPPCSTNHPFSGPIIARGGDCAKVLGTNRNIKTNRKPNRLFPKICDLLFFIIPILSFNFILGPIRPERKRGPRTTPESSGMSLFRLNLSERESETRRKPGKTRALHSPRSLPSWFDPIFHPHEIALRPQFSFGLSAMFIPSD